jgi:NUDIX domain-containing protein
MDFKAAGVLPVAIHDGQLYLLLGRERYYNTWCGFGGGRDDSESILQTAGREFMEESMAIIMSEEEIYQILEQNLDNRLLLRYQLDGYVEHVVLIEYDSELPKLFDRLEKQFNRCSRLIDRSCKTGQCAITGEDPSVTFELVCSPLFEKDMMEWFTFEEIMELAITENGCDQITENRCDQITENRCDQITEKICDQITENGCDQITENRCDQILSNLTSSLPSMQLNDRPILRPCFAKTILAAEHLYHTITY